MTAPDVVALGIETDSSAEGVALLATGSARRNVLDLDDFSAEEITSVLEDTGAMVEVLRRDIKKVPTLRGRVVVTMFYESSTRTRISFEEAGKVLSADVINMSGSGSSVDKGESLLNTGLTLQAMGVDVVVVRHPHSGAPYLLARHLPQVSVINAGDGLHAHPTQALLDLYTMRERLGSLRDSKVVIVGDVLHSRVARSKLMGFDQSGGAGGSVRPHYADAPGLAQWPRRTGRRPSLCPGGGGYRPGPGHRRRRRGNGPAPTVGTAAERLSAQPAGVHPALAGYRGTAGPGQARALW